MTRVYQVILSTVSKQIATTDSGKVLLAQDPGNLALLASLADSIARNLASYLVLQDEVVDLDDLDDHSACTHPCGLAGCDPAANRDRAGAKP